MADKTDLTRGNGALPFPVPVGYAPDTSATTLPPAVATTGVKGPTDAYEVAKAQPGALPKAAVRSAATMPPVPIPDVPMPSPDDMAAYAPLQADAQQILQGIHNRQAQSLPKEGKTAPSEVAIAQDLATSYLQDLNKSASSESLMFDFLRLRAAGDAKLPKILSQLQDITANSRSSELDIEIKKNQEAAEEMKKAHKKAGFFGVLLKVINVVVIVASAVLIAFALPSTLALVAMTAVAAATASGGFAKGIANGKIFDLGLALKIAEYGTLLVPGLMLGYKLAMWSVEGAIRVGTAAMASIQQNGFRTAVRQAAMLGFSRAGAMISASTDEAVAAIKNFFKARCQQIKNIGAGQSGAAAAGAAEPAAAAGAGAADAAASGWRVMPKRLRSFIMRHYAGVTAVLIGIPDVMDVGFQHGVLKLKLNARSLENEAKFAGENADLYQQGYESLNEALEGIATNRQKAMRKSMEQLSMYHSLNSKILTI